MTLRISRESVTLKQKVIERVRCAITDGTFGSGQKLVEKDLCERLDVSRPLLREVLQHLEVEGLVQNIPHKGCVVASISEEMARSIYKVREVLEGMAAEGFVQHASDVQVQALRTSVDWLRTQQLSATDHELLVAKNAFYRIVFDGCGNTVIAQILTQLNNRITVLRHSFFSLAGRSEQNWHELDTIVRAIEDRDASRAKALFSEHVAEAGRVALQHFGSQGRFRSDIDSV